MRPDRRVVFAAALFALASLGLASGQTKPLASTLEADQSAGKVPAGLPPPPADPHDLAGVWVAFQRPSAAPLKGNPTAPPPATGGVFDDNENAPYSTQLCAPDAVFDLGAAGFDVELIQDSREIVVVGEAQQNFRFIRLNAVHRAEFVPTRNGDSVGHWEGNTLVVDTTGLTAQGGVPTDAHVIEHISKTDNGTTLEDKMTILEPSHGAPIERDLTAKWRPDIHLGENVCEEGFSHFKLKHGVLVIDYGDAG